jgi:hypothetical protein
VSGPVVDNKYPVLIGDITRSANVIAGIEIPHFSAAGVSIQEGVSRGAEDDQGRFVAFIYECVFVNQ